MTEKKLTAKQEMFCQEYLVDLNATQAAIRAGYSANAATEIASENLTKPNIKNYLSKIKEKRQEQTQINAEWVLKQAEECYHALKSQNAHKHALKALDLIGRHTNIKAFDDKYNQMKEAVNVNVNFMNAGRKDNKAELIIDNIKIKTSYEK